MMGGSAVLETYLHRGLPPGVEMATTRIPFRSVSYQGLVEMTDRIPEAAKILAEARPHVIAVTSFTGSCIRGAEIVNMVQQATGIPAIVPAQETVRVLKAMGARRVAMATCFNQELRTLEQVYFSGKHIEITKFIEVAVFQGGDPYRISQFDSGMVVSRLRREDFRDTDAVVVDLPTFVLWPERLKEIESTLPVPVLSMADVLLWSALEKVGAPAGGLYLARCLSRADAAGPETAMNF